MVFSPKKQSNEWLSILAFTTKYKKVLCIVDLTKDFFFSSSYHIMRSLPRNMCDNEQAIKNRLKTIFFLLELSMVPLKEECKIQGSENRTDHRTALVTGSLVHRFNRLNRD
ncbi:hypothetical protein Ahy_A05g024826 isoform C [Arachis hypogaea]|uniref:Uncharacterized protein n=1 Tax=Arachis hypogaea TaxID=3818 RepID=A0A445D7K7_ARAHY|nr:hypothetical protein Ahy_A05g024826 isoform C [Arachis hypogaea]